MTHIPNNTISANFAQCASSTTSGSPTPSIGPIDGAFYNDSMPDIEDIIAAILSEDHALSAEQLMAFESLLETPDTDANHRQALLQAIWNIVVCIIDNRWENMVGRGSGQQNVCGPIGNTDNQPTTGQGELLESVQSNYETESNGAAGDAPRRKGRHDNK